MNLGDRLAVIEMMADMQHKIWSHWMRWFFENDTPENRERWKRQMRTAYADLSDREKESDRKVIRDEFPQALNYIAAQAERITALEGEIGHLHRRQHPSDAPSEVKARTATAIARGMGELVPYGARETYKQAIKDALEVCRARGAVLEDSDELK